jgi:Uma2 family endonuclease
MVAILFEQLAIEPGERVILRNVDWPRLEAILQELGDDRNTRIAYCDEVLEIMAPLPEHEISKESLADLVKILLEELGIDCIAIGSTTLKKLREKAGVEPDSAFYIQNCARMQGQLSIDLAIDPPPDLAIEIDLTSKTKLDAYLAIGVPEIWRYDQGKLSIDILQEGQYMAADQSAILPLWLSPVVLIAYTKRIQTGSRLAAIRDFRATIRAQMPQAGSL